ncbi:Clavaminate synthase-like protein [Penicillium argentinense]|uniref:Clavaminate synthase-like protein n=1 Tax=Penicillium argentinense TaxID=1131581 RepID=A0A9W9G0C9_9EURO|nr:Clavaminate synthase-like protein [Penicillium argentinense]KAJ5109748.1 Clavaminate synthase-like protein [Penicillium argentinense]
MTQTTTSPAPAITKVIGEQSLKIADLSVINADKLAANDPAATETLLKAAKSPGFFYLSFDEPASENIAKDINTLYEACEKYFAQSGDEKMKDFREGVDRGYKKGPGHESFEIAREEKDTITLPTKLVPYSNVLRDFSSVCDNYSRICLRALSAGLGLEGQSHLENTHNPNDPNDSGLKLLSGPTEPTVADVPNTTHTDGGSITFLWCGKWASQVQIPETKEWLWIEPTSRCVLVNIANSLQKQTDGTLHSPVHRVTQPTDGVEDRFMVSYFFRPSKTF